MFSGLREKLSGAASVLEMLLGIIIMVGCVICALGLIFKTDVVMLFRVPGYLQVRLSDACMIIIGVELIKMITSYTIDSVVDVMLLAVARQMIVEHTAPLENLLAVMAVGLLFVIRKYLYISQIDRRKSRREVQEALHSEVFGLGHLGRKKKNTADLSQMDAQEPKKKNE